MSKGFLEKDIIQYKTVCFVNGKTTKFDLGSGNWLTDLSAAKGSCTKLTNGNKEFIKYLENKIANNNFHDTYPESGKLTADWYRQVAIKGLEENKQYVYKVVYHDAEYIYDYETKEPIMSIEEYFKD